MTSKMYRKYLFGQTLASAGLLAGAAQAQSVSLATGPDDSVDGYLEVTPDAYGAWEATSWLGYGDTFNPAGSIGPSFATFSALLSVFVGTEGAALGSNINLLGTYPGTLLISAGANTASDTNSDGVNDTATSTFNVTNLGDVNLDFVLTQSVSNDGGTVSVLLQTYEITNNSASPVDMKLARNFDGDLSFDGAANYYENDEVGTTANGAGNGQHAYMSEVGDSATAICLSSPEADVYYGSKLGVDPGSAGVPFGYGTDTIVWQNYGIPTSWENYCAGVGYDVNGASGAQPAGSASPYDASLGLGWSISLAAGESTTINIYHTYGSTSPLGGPTCDCLADLAGADCGTNTNDFFAFLGFYQAGNPAADFSPGGGINTNDFFAYLAAYQADLNNPDCPN